MKKLILVVVLVGVVVFFASGCQSRGLEGASGISGEKAAENNAPHENAATIDGDVQTVTTRFSSRSYAPITLQAGMPVKWIIQMDKADLNGCNNEMIIPKYGIDQKLSAGETIVTFTPTQTGTIPYSCWMGMIRSSITVVDSLDGA